MLVVRATKKLRDRFGPPSLAPATTLLARFPAQAAAVLAAHRTPDTIIGAELQ